MGTDGIRSPATTAVNSVHLSNIELRKSIVDQRSTTISNTWTAELNKIYEYFAAAMD